MYMTSMSFTREPSAMMLDSGRPFHPRQLTSEASRARPRLIAMC